MTRDEQKEITAFVERTVADNQPALDVEADAIIRALFVRNPDAAYRMTMLAMKQAREPQGQGGEKFSTAQRVKKPWFLRFLPKTKLRPHARETVPPASFQLRRVPAEAKKRR